MELSKLTALQLADKIKKHEISVLDGVKEVFSQIEEKDGQIHAYLDTYKKEAYARAKEVQKGIDEGIYTGPLAGVPIAVKDNICVQGKPTTCASKILEGFVPQYQAEVIDRLEKVGKDVADCAALLEVIAGHDPKDSTSIDRHDLDFGKEMTDKIAGMKFGVPKEYLAEGLSPDVKDAFMETLKVLTQMGAIVEFFSVKTMEYMIPAYYIIASAEASSNLERFDGVKYGYRAAEYDGLHDMYKRTRTEGFGEEVKRRIMLGSFVLSSGYYDAYYLKALRTKALIKKEFDEAFEKYDVLLAPAAPYTAPKLGESLKDPMAMYLGDIYTVAVNLCGLPGITVPCGKDKIGLPIGIQMIGDCFMEKKILRAAHAYEKARGDFGTPEEGGREA